MKYAHENQSFNRCTVMHSLNQWILYNWWPLLLRSSFWYTKEFQSIRESPHWPHNPSKEWDYPSRGRKFFKCHLKRSFCLIIATGLMLPQQVYKTVDIPLAWQRFSAWAKILPYNQVALPFFKTLFCCCSIQVRDLLPLFCTSLPNACKGKLPEPYRLDYEPGHGGIEV